MRFGKDGRCVAIPGQAQIPPTARVPSYPVVEKYGLIWVWMGDAATATVEMIPDLPWMEEAAWVPTKGYTYIRADYRLLNDNLLDLSHESYIHEGTIGNDETDSIAEYPLSVTVEDGRVIRAHRDMINIDPPPFFAMILETEQKIDRWQAAIWAAPAINITDVGVVGAGLPHSAAYINRVLHLITPETETSSHYFWALCRNYRLSDAALGTSVHAALAKTFHEDKVMLELQQKALLNRYERSIPGVATKLDDAPLRARRILSMLIKQESEIH
jgi:vanillate O-demethylase monooxygenase subunit